MPSHCESHGRYVAFQMAEVAIPRNLFADILRLIINDGGGRTPRQRQAFEAMRSIENLGRRVSR